MRNESGIALILVMGLLLAMSLIGVGLISQTITNSKFSEAIGNSYIGLALAQKNLADITVTNGPITTLTAGIGKKPDGTIAAILYAVPAPAIGGSSNGTVKEGVWKPGFCGKFYQNEKNIEWLTTADGTITDSFYSKGKKGLDESAFLFKDNAGPNGADVLDSWTNYSLHLEFNAGLSPDFGVYYNAGPVNDTEDKSITGYLFRISPINDTFSINEVHNGNLNPGSSFQTKSFSDSSLRDATGTNPFENWSSGTSAGTGTPFDTWHSIDVMVTGQPGETHVITAKVDGVTIFSYPGITNPHFQPNLIGLSNWSGEGWGTSTAPASVTWRNISVTNATP